MKKHYFYIELFDIYGKLLTKRQQVFFTLYYLENLTIEEISKKHHISKSAVSQSLIKITYKLCHYENIVQAWKMKEKLENLSKSK